MAVVGLGTATGITAAANFIPEIWSMKLLDEYVAAAVIADRVDRRFEPELKKGNTVHVGVVAKVSPRAKTSNTAITWDTTTEDKQDVVVDQDFYVAREFETMATLQSQIDMMNAYIKMDAKALAELIDCNVGTLFDGLNGDTTIGTLLADVTDDEMIQCVTTLAANSVPMEDRSWIISPEMWGSLMKLDKFVRLDYVNPSGGTAVERAKLSYPIYGAPVYVTPSVEGTTAAGHNCVLMHKQACMLIVQQEPKVYKQFVIQMLADGLVTEAIYGFAEERDLAGVCLKGK